MAKANAVKWQYKFLVDDSGTLWAARRHEHIQRNVPVRQADAYRSTFELGYFILCLRVKGMLLRRSIPLRQQAKLLLFGSRAGTGWDVDMIRELLKQYD